MPSLIKRGWNSSPASWARAIQRRLQNSRRKDRWHRVTAGPAAGVELLLPTPLEPWAREMVAGTFDDFFYAALSERRPLDGARCWDIGAHLGYHALAFATQGASVVAFEPAAANLVRLRQHLERNAKLAQRIRLVSAAVADRDGELTFRQNDELAGVSAGSHLTDAAVPLPAEAYAHFQEVTVPAIQLDTFLRRADEPAPDVIKIDVEGAELRVLEGGRRLLAEHRPLLLMEIHHICQMFGVQKLLHSLGYQLSILDETRATPSRCFLLAERG